MKSSDRLAVYCTHCRMWFDTAKGWRAIKIPPFGIPGCPCCGAPLMQTDYYDFIKRNRERGRFVEVMTWEYPDGSFWKEKNNERKRL